MSIFAGIATDETIAVEEDRIGGGSNKLSQTGKYDFIIKKAYMDSAKSGAVSLNLELETEDGKKLKVTEYVTNKAKQTFYLDKEGNKKFLPGFSKMKAIDYLIVKKDQEFPKAEKKTIMLYDYMAKKDIPQEKDVLTEWWGKPITALVMKKLENKQVKGDDDKYVDTAETREVFEVEHFLDPVTLRTRNEITLGSASKLCVDWTAKFGGDYVRDARTIKDGVASPAKESVNQATANAIFG